MESNPTNNPIEDNLEVGSSNEEELEEISSSIQKKHRGTIDNKRKRRLTSKAWKMFDLVTIEPGGKQYSICKKCGIQYIAEGNHGTKNMLRHMKICKKATREDVEGISNSKDSIMSSSRFNFDPDKFRELLVSAIIMHDLPFQFVEYEGIRAILSYLCDDLKHISRNTVKADVLKIYTREKNRLKEAFESIPGRINLTSDLWTSIATDGYICLTAHYIDHEWKLQNRVLNLSYMPPPHSGVAICEKIYKLLVDWKIEKKLFSLTLDNASSNDVFVDLLKKQLNLKEALLGKGEFFHIRCCTHILNLIVKDGLKEVDGCIYKIRESVKYIKGSQIRKQKFWDCVSHESLEVKKSLRQDVPTRWNSTFLMLESALHYRRAFMHMQLSDSNYSNLCPSQEEWDKAEKIKRFLATFYNVTCLFSGTNYPTANLYFLQVFVVQRTLKSGMVDSDEYVKSIATTMYKKFEKYWSEYNVLLAIACILDPRYKMQFVEFCYFGLYGRNSKELKNVKDKLFSLFDEYSNNISIERTRNLERSSKEGTSCGYDGTLDQDCIDVLREFDSFESQEIFCSQKTQLELYLDEPRLDRGAQLDILSYWKTNQHRYPELSLLARDIMAVPISTVASESTFSVSGRILNQYRSSLKPSNVEALVCGRDWLYGIKGDMETEIDELTEDIMQLHIGQSVPTQQEDIPQMGDHFGAI